ncbi:hypothetical protein [Butyrivibrio proteoclasticus]|uniref:hypothetical protein n=1 Tax=Butyrivibrio proteoclasticus TaxID=43305 RepID=UPI00047D2D74|nr:hypothetical protein [Butyrivibrio proteoclasticus]
MKTKKSEITIVFLILVAALFVNIYFGFSKAGFHEDEYYTYFSSNRSIGLYQPDRQWQDRQTILDEFVVKPGEGFNYGLVKLVQSWDVHPPFYYFIFHTANSLVPNVFTKWTGIVVNIIAFVISFFLLYLLLKRLKAPFEVEILTLVFWALNPQTVSCNMLIRMYAWLTVFILACAYTHVRFIQDYDKVSKKDLMIKYLIPIMAVSYVGFLIQYFYLFFFFGIGLGTFVWLIRTKKEIKQAFIYAGLCAVSLMLSVITYPASVRHMLGGYRGNEATSSLFSLGDTGMRIAFFVGLLNNYVFAGGLIIVLFFIIGGMMYRIIHNKKSVKISDSGIVLSFAAFVYFLLTAKSALLVGSASNRYEMPIYGLLILIFVYDLYLVLDNVGNKMIMYGVSLALMAFLLKGFLYDHNVLFLFEEDKAKIEYARDNKDEVAVVMFKSATAYNVWRLTDELLEYDEVYYMDVANTEKIEDPKVTGADKIILYMADDDCDNEAMDNILESCPRIEGYVYVHSEDMWTTYELE